MSPQRKGPSHFIRFEWDDQWWEPSTDIISMDLRQRRPSPDELRVWLYGHAMPLSPDAQNIRIRCSWDRQVYWSGTAPNLVAEIGSANSDPTTDLTFYGTFRREP